MDLSATLASAAAFCSFGEGFAGYGLSAALFGIGLFGGLAHCGPMCAPFVLMQLPETADSGGSLRRLTANALPAYHLGRMTTYTALGAAAGGLGASIADATELRWMFAIPLALVAVLFLRRALSALFGIRHELPSLGWGSKMGTYLARFAGPLLRRPPGGAWSLHGYALGILLGFLPCGFLYAAVIAAAAGGSAVSGAVAMAGFALGTTPTLLAVGLAGALAVNRWRSLARTLAAPAYLIGAATLGSMAFQLIG